MTNSYPAAHVRKVCAALREGGPTLFWPLPGVEEKIPAAVLADLLERGIRARDAEVSARRGQRGSEAGCYS